MRDFNYAKIAQQKWDSEILELVAAIYYEAGKQTMYLKEKPAELEKLVEIAKIQSTDSSNAIEGICTTKTRLRQLVQDKTTPHNRSEQEILGYRNALNHIHQHFASDPISQDFILNLHKIMLGPTQQTYAGKIKSAQNYIMAFYPDGHKKLLFEPVSPQETPKALASICQEYNLAVGNYRLEPLIAIAVFIFDFICIHPFDDGNGRLSRLLTILLLYRHGFYVGRYISLEAHIAKTKSLYYLSLRESQEGWHEGVADVSPFIKYFLGIVVSAYRDFADRFALVGGNDKALEIVKHAARNLMGKLTKQDIWEQCPSLSISSVEIALRKLVDKGDLAREGKSRSTVYYHLK